MDFVNPFHNGIVFQKVALLAYKFLNPLTTRFDNLMTCLDLVLFRRNPNVFDNRVLLILSPVRSLTPDTAKALEALAAVERLQSQLL